MYKTISMAEFEETYRKNDQINLIDVREADEYANRHIPGAKSVPLSGFPVELDKTKTYHVVCESGGRAAMACEYLASNGYDVVNVMGGTSAWGGEME